jgi:hypothetical protein
MRMLLLLFEERESSECFVDEVVLETTDWGRCRNPLVASNRKEDLLLVEDEATDEGDDGG